MGGEREDRPPQQPLAQRAAPAALHLRPRVLDQLVVLHAGRAGRDAGHAAEAVVECVDHRRRELAALLEPGPHQHDAPAGRVHLLAPERVGRAGGQAEAAVHAVVDQLRLRAAGSRRRRASCHRGARPRGRSAPSRVPSASRAPRRGAPSVVGAHLRRGRRARRRARAPAPRAAPRRASMASAGERSSRRTYEIPSRRGPTTRPATRSGRGEDILRAGSRAPTPAPPCRPSSAGPRAAPPRRRRRPPRARSSAPRRASARAPPRPAPRRPRRRSARAASPSPPPKRMSSPSCSSGACARPRGGARRAAPRRSAEPDGRDRSLGQRV